MSQLLAHLESCAPPSSGEALLGGLHDEGLVDVWNDTTAGNGCLDESVELLVSSDSKLQMSWGNSLNFEILGGVACKLEDLSGKILKNSSTVDS